MSKREPRDPTARKVAALTGLTYRQVWRLARKGCIPCTIIGRRMVMTPAQFEQLDRDGVKPEPKDTDEQSPFIRRIA